MFFGLLLLLAAQRGVELQISASNVAHLKTRGAVEVGRGHYPVMVALHTGWFLALVLERWHYPNKLSWDMVAVGWTMLLLGQGLRWLAISTLGRRWTTRVLVLPGEPTVKRGIFRFLRHPNYFGVCLELAGVPLIGGCWRSALMFSALNLALLSHRVKIEERALREAAE